VLGPGDHTVLVNHRDHGHNTARQRCGWWCRWYRQGRRGSRCWRRRQSYWRWHGRWRRGRSLARVDAPEGVHRPGGEAGRREERCRMWRDGRCRGRGGRPWPGGRRDGCRPSWEAGRRGERGRAWRGGRRGRGRAWHGRQRGARGCAGCRGW
jgi:hypothetical protein